jgi:multidrug efflux pump subunit AcrA (membrane-fusion protein)
MKRKNPLRAVFRSHSLPALALVVAASAAAGLGGCSKAYNGPAANPATPTAGTAGGSFSLVKPERVTLYLSVRQPGSIYAYEQTPIFSKLAGYVQKWHVDIGDRLRKGDLLAELWVPEMEVELKQKEALVQQAEAEIKQATEAAAAAEASLGSAEAKIKEAESGRLRAKAQYDRMKSQFERLARVGQSGVLDKDSVEETRYGFEAAAAGLEEVEAKVKSAEAGRDESAAKLRKARTDIIVAEAHLQVAKQNRDQVTTLLQYAKLTAPFDGVVTKRNVATDHFVQPATGTKAEPLFVVERRDIVRVFVEVPEADAGWVNKGNPARIRVQAIQGQEFSGEVTRTSYALDRTARTLVAEIDLPNPKDQLRPGMYVLATITAEQPDVLALPAAAIATEGDVTRGYQSYCFIVDGGKAVRTPVQVGRSDGKFVEVLSKQKSGSPAAWEPFTGQEMVAGSAKGLIDGQTVPDYYTPTK